jgi:hypothetical protein
MYKWLRVSVGYLGLLTVLSIASPADATLTSSAEVMSITIVNSSNAAIVSLSKLTSGRPACHTSSTQEYTFDITTNTGKAMLSAAQAALLAGKQVTVIGTATCNVAGIPVESVSRLAISRTQVP